MRISSGRALGRVDVAWAGAGTVLVSWMETTPEGAALRVRPVPPGGAPGPVTMVTPMDPARASGFPQMAVHGDSAYFAWTVPGTPSRLRMAVAPVL